MGRRLRSGGLSACTMKSCMSEVAPPILIDSVGAEGNWISVRQSKTSPPESLAYDTHKSWFARYLPTQYGKAVIYRADNSSAPAVV